MPTVSSRDPDPRVKSTSIVLAEQDAQWLFTDQEIANSPSARDGMSQQAEDDVRKKALSFITQVGIMLKLPQLTLYTAGIFLNRFFMRHSLVAQKGQPKPLHHYQIGAIAIFLASKTEENCRKTRELIVACCRVALEKPELIIDEQSKDYWRWRDTLLLYEDVLLEALCFDLAIESPHKLLFELLKVLKVEHNKKLRSAAWTFVNDSAMTTLGIRYSARIIAASAVYCAARFIGLDARTLQEKTPKVDENGAEEPKDESKADGHTKPDESKAPQSAGLKQESEAWWDVHRVSLKQIKSACNFMADMYADTAKEGADGEASIYVGLRSPLTDYGLDTGPMSVSAEGLNKAQDPPSPDDMAASASNTPAPTQAEAVSAESRGTKRERDGTPKPSVPSSKPANEAKAKKEDDAGSEEGEVEE